MNVEMSIEIQKDVPMISPSASPGGPKGAIRKAMEACEVGDSFFTTQKSAAAYAAPLKPKKFSARGCVENGVKGSRIWRIA